MSDHSTKTMDDSTGAGHPDSGRELESLTGRNVSHYRILDKIGQGGMGVVYRGLDVRLQRDVAVKFASKKGLTNPALHECLRREAHLGSALNHPNVCAVFDVGAYAGRPFVVMELMEGQTLRQRIGVTLDLHELLHLGIQICEGLNAVHTSGIVHRDIKPSNIFITTAGRAKVFDFGLAITSCETGLAGDSRPEDSRAVDARGPVALLGTPAYMSPEQVLGKPLDRRSDLFSFGVVLYEMLSGERPFQGVTTAFLLDAVLCRTNVPIQARKPGLPPEVGQIIDKALEKDRARRYGSAAEICADIKRLQVKLKGRRNGRRLPIAAAG